MSIHWNFHVDVVVVILLEKLFYANIVRISIAIQFMLLYALSSRMQKIRPTFVWNSNVRTWYMHILPQCYKHWSVSFLNIEAAAAAEQQRQMCQCVQYGAYRKKSIKNWKYSTKFNKTFTHRKWAFGITTMYEIEWVCVWVWTNKKNIYDEIGWTMLNTKCVKNKGYSCYVHLYIG